MQQVELARSGERATAECVERDAISLALCALAAGRQRQPGRLIDLESLPAPQRSLGQRFRDSGLRLAVRELPYTEYFWEARRIWWLELGCRDPRDP